MRVGEGEQLPCPRSGDEQAARQTSGVITEAGEIATSRLRRPTLRAQHSGDRSAGLPHGSTCLQQPPRNVRFTQALATSPLHIQLPAGAAGSRPRRVILVRDATVCRVSRGGNRHRRVRRNTAKGAAWRCGGGQHSQRRWGGKTRGLLPLEPGSCRSAARQPGRLGTTLWRPRFHQLLKLRCEARHISCLHLPPAKPWPRVFLRAAFYMLPSTRCPGRSAVVTGGLGSERLLPMRPCTSIDA